MRRIGTVLIVIVILFGGLGFYRGWFALTRPAAQEGSDTVNVNLATDPGKMKQDLHMAEDKATALTGGVTDNVKADGQVQ
jgi:hypothetical protein